MRTGAILARGSCRTLRWMALFGVVFALGVGQAAAQTDLSVKSVTIAAASASGDVDEDIETMVTITLNTKVPDDEDNNVTATATVTLTPGFMMGDAGDTGNAEFDDLRINRAILSDATPISLTINEGADSVSVPFHARRDGDAVDEKFRLTGTLTAVSDTDSAAIGTPAAVMSDFKIKDSDTQEYELVLKGDAKKVMEDGTFMVTIKADPPRPTNESAMFEVLASDRQYTFDYTDEDDAAQTDRSTGMVTVTVATNNGYESGELTVNTPMSDGNRESDTITISAYPEADRQSAAEVELDVTVLDKHALPARDKITAEAMDKKKDGTKVTSVKEGEMVYLTVTVDRGDNGYPDGEELKVELKAADSSQGLDFRLSATSVTIPSGEKKKSQTEDPVVLEIVADEDIGEETLMLHLVATGKTAKNGSGESMGMFEIMIEDATPPMVWAKDGAMEAIYGARIEAQGPDGMINPGDDFEIMTDDLFGHLPTVTVDYAASSDNSSVSVSASGEKIMVMPQAMEGMAKITVTATATPMADAFKTQQTTSNIAQIMFELDVKLAALTYMIMDPEDMHLIEGSASAMVKVMASRALDGDETAEVMLMRDGSSSATMDDYTVMPEMVMLKAGDTMAEFTVMATEDSMPDSGAGMPEMLTLFVVVDDMQMTDQSVMFYIWDMAVPALPIIAQLLLGGLLAVGGFRRYRRRS